MPQALTYPGVYVEEVPSGVRTIAGVATSIGLFIGWANKGPIDEGDAHLQLCRLRARIWRPRPAQPCSATRCSNFFDNGGSDAYIIRVLPPDEPDDSSREAPGDRHRDHRLT